MALVPDAVDATLGRVYGAALAVADDEQAAAEVSRRVLAPALQRAARTGEPPDAEALVARALLLAVRLAPGGAFARMPLPEREVAALARPGGLAVGEIAALVGIPEAAVKAYLLAALRAAAAASVEALT